MNATMYVGVIGKNVFNKFVISIIINKKQENLVIFPRLICINCKMK